MEELKKIIRDVPDFPKKGIIFKDITTLLKDGKYFRQSADLLAKHFRKTRIDKVVSIESRGFIFGSVLAYKLGSGFVPVRKKGKLPFKTISVSYDLEYGKDTLEIHKDAIEPGDRVLIADDLLATGGTAKAVIELIEKLGAKIVGCAFLIELGFLNGGKKLKKYKVFSLIKY
jgi:adenine phosphoribosyltransferase